MRLLCLILMSLPGWALSNAVTHHATGTVPATQVHCTSRFFAEGEIANYPRPFISNTGAASWQAEVKTRWPAGSVQHAIVCYQAGITAASSIVVDFRNTTDACHLGGLSTCLAAALDRQGMLDYGGGTWTAIMAVEANPKGSTTTRTTNARTMINNEHFTYWVRGPVMTVVRAEDASTARAYDFGWNTSGCSQPYDTCTWADDTTHRSLHPMFILSFPKDAAAVKIEYILANYWTTTRQDQRYAISLQTSAGEVFQKSDVRSAWSTWWRKTFWDGAPPSPVRTDFNLEYLRHSKAVMPYRLPVTIKQTGDYSKATSLARFNNNVNADFPFACTMTTDYCGSRFRFYPATGGRDDRGFYPIWEAQYLHSMDAELYEVVIKNAEYVSSQNIHIRESGTGLSYRTGVDAFGLPNSLDARPTVWRQSESVSNLPAAVGPLAAQNQNSGSFTRWSVDAAHQHTHAQLAYLLTGDWFFLQEQAFLAHHNFLWFQQAGYTTITRKGTWGFISAVESNHRLVAWLMWNIWRGYLFLPDGDPQKGYLREKLEDATAIFEGYYDITDGDHYEACTSNPYSPTAENSRWCWGHRMMGYTARGNLGLSSMIGSSAQRQNLSTSQVLFGSSPWMDNLVSLAFFDMCRTEGRACPIARHHAKRQVQAFETSGGHARMLVWYHMPVTRVRSTTLTASITNSQLTLPVADASICPETPTVVYVGTIGAGEWVYIASKDVGTNTLNVGTTFYAGRSYGVSGAKAASSGAPVYYLEQFTNFADMRAAYTGSSTYDLAGELVRGGIDGVGDNYVTLQCGAAIWSEDFSRSARAGEAWRAACSDTDLGGAAAKYSKEADPRWWLESDRPIHQVRAAVSGGTATLNYVAPSGAACRVYVGNAPPVASDDAGDPEDTAAGRQHTFTASGLTAGTKHYRIACGVVRASGTFVVP